MNQGRDWGLHHRRESLDFDLSGDCRDIRGLERWYLRGLRVSHVMNVSLGHGVPNLGSAQTFELSLALMECGKTR